MYKRVFEQRGIASRMHLKRRMLSLHLTVVRLVREYRATGSKMEELNLCHLLLTLGSAYSTVVTALETMPDYKLSMEFVKCRLLDEEVSGMGGVLNHAPLKVSDIDSSPEKSSRVQWLIDSSCSDHVVNDRALFEKLEPLDSPVEIAIAMNGETILAKYSGTVRILAPVKGKYFECFVNNVLYVPELRSNLFSVMKVEKIGMKVMYHDGKVWIRRGSELVACGSRCGKLYRLVFSLESPARVNHY